MLELESIITIQDEQGNDIGDFIGFIIPRDSPYQLKTNIRGLKEGYKIITKTKKFVITEVGEKEYGLNEIEKLKKEEKR